MRRPSTTQQFRTRLPVVNLLSPAVFEAMAVRTLRRRFVLAGCALVLLVAGGWGVQDLRVSQAEKILTIEQAETSRLTAQTQELAPVRTFVATVSRQKATIAETMAHEALFSQLLDELRAATPGAVQVESSEVTMQPPDAGTSAPADGSAPESTEPATEPAPTAPTAVSACPGPDPFNTKTVIGCVTLSGSATDRDSVGAFVIRLGDSDLFIEPFITTTTTADGARVMFTGSVGISRNIFSKRYDDIDLLISEEAAR